MDNNVELTKEQREKELELLRNSYDMYQTSKQETIETRKNKKDKDGNRIYSDESLEKTLELMDTMEDDIVTKYVQLGGNPEDLKKRKVKKRNDKRIKESVERVSVQDTMREYALYMKEEAKKREGNKYADIERQPEVAEEKPVEQKPSREKNAEILRNIQNEKFPTMDFDALVAQKPYENANNFELPKPKEEKVENREAGVTGQKANFDEVALPSRGECYRSKNGRIKVSHLVAYDENLILSPGLYRNGTFLDHILKNKILDPIDPDDLIQGDRDAIIIWLRAGGYGPLYPIRMTDPDSSKEFETNVDLSSLSFKKFTLTGDENGYFDFKLPQSGDMIKFRFLTAGDAKKLEKMRNEENENDNATSMRESIREVLDFIEKSDKFTSKEKEGMTADLQDLEEIIYDRYKNVEDTYFTHDLTNRLILSTVSVNGVSDRNYVMNYVMNMNLKDASEYRKYILDNEPGIDYNIKVKRPDSLGGGYIDTFLQLDQFIFIY